MRPCVFCCAALALLSGLSVSSARAQQRGPAKGAAPEADEHNPPPPADGIHDGEVEGTALLQSPQEAFADLPKANSGNYVNWTEALNSGQTTPLFDLAAAGVKPTVLDLDIVRRVKAGPPAVFPHAAHTQLFECPICHPGLFIAKKGANSMSMSEIMLGKKCGVCHGTVAFPAAECRRCHYEPKSPADTTGQASRRVRAADKTAERSARNKVSHPQSKPVRPH